MFLASFEGDRPVHFCLRRRLATARVRPSYSFSPSVVFPSFPPRRLPPRALFLSLILSISYTGPPPFQRPLSPHDSRPHPPPSPFYRLLFFPRCPSSSVCFSQSSQGIGLFVGAAVLLKFIFHKPPSPPVPPFLFFFLFSSSTISVGSIDLSNKLSLEPGFLL